MIVVLRPSASPSEVEAVVQRVRLEGFQPQAAHDGDRHVLIFSCPDRSQRLRVLGQIRAMPGVESATEPARPYEVVAPHYEGQRREVSIGEIGCGGREFTVIAGPCSIESEESLALTISQLATLGVKAVRAGAYKPSTSPYGFQGLRKRGLEILRSVASEFGVATVTEVLDVRDVPLVGEYADCLQIGARNMQNFELLKEVGRQTKPVLLKRGPGAKVDEWLLAAEYIATEGNLDILLCERGIRTFESGTRNTLDLAGAALARLLTQLPVLADPSHSTGRRDLVGAMSVAAVGAGLDGLLIEVHAEPSHSEKDGAQTFPLEEFETLIRPLKAVAEGVGRSLDSLHPTSAAATS